MSRITKVKCPCCKGSGKMSLFDSIPCMWCRGTKHLIAKKAIEYANVLITLGHGGYICGDLDWEDRCRMIGEADTICHFLQIPPISPELTR